MILPDHPGNTGDKPLIIGNREQVDAQMNYIYRGNYGLVSEQEIHQAGTTLETAQAMMRMKRRFAFGKIRGADELLDTLAVESEPKLSHERKNIIGPGDARTLKAYR